MLSVSHSAETAAQIATKASKMRPSVSTDYDP